MWCRRYYGDMVFGRVLRRVACCRVCLALPCVAFFFFLRKQGAKNYWCCLIVFTNTTTVQITKQNKMVFVSSRRRLLRLRCDKHHSLRMRLPRWVLPVLRSFVSTSLDPVAGSVFSCKVQHSRPWQLLLKGNQRVISVGGKLLSYHIIR